MLSSRPAEGSPPILVMGNNREPREHVTKSQDRRTDVRTVFSGHVEARRDIILKKKQSISQNYTSINFKTIFGRNLSDSGSYIGDSLENANLPVRNLYEYIRVSSIVLTCYNIVFYLFKKGAILISYQRVKEDILNMVVVLNMGIFTRIAHI